MSAPLTSILSVELLSRVIDVKYACFTFFLPFILCSASPRNNVLPSLKKVLRADKEKYEIRFFVLC